MLAQAPGLENPEQPPFSPEDAVHEDLTPATVAKGTENGGAKEDANENGRPAKKPRKLTPAQRKKAEAAAKVRGLCALGNVHGFGGTHAY